MKLAGSKEEPAPATPTNDAPLPDSGFGDDTQSSSDDKPFDSEPFDAGVEADEESDPKKFIEQLTGKLGQSLRKYNESQGQPDYELEKFAINSLLAACHTGDMDQNDQDDIIKKVKSGGNDDSQDDSQDNNDNSDVDTSSTDDGSNDFSGDIGGDNGGDTAPSPEINEEKKTQVEIEKATLYPDGWMEMDGIFMNPKKNNMFQPGSNDILGDDLKESKKSSIFVNIKNRLKETFNQEDTMSEPMIEPQIAPTPTVTPEVKPNIAPSRKNKPFLPMPEVKPDPKASK